MLSGRSDLSILLASSSGLCLSSTYGNISTHRTQALIQAMAKVCGVHNLIYIVQRARESYSHRQIKKSQRNKVVKRNEGIGKEGQRKGDGDIQREQREGRTETDPTHEACFIVRKRRSGARPDNAQALFKKSCSSNSLAVARLFTSTHRHTLKNALSSSESASGFFNVGVPLVAIR